MNELNTLSLENEAGFKALFQYTTVGVLVISEGGGGSSYLTHVHKNCSAMINPSLKGNW